MAKKLVSIVITTRDRKDIILACLSSIFKMDYPNFEVILIDNASTDGTAEAVKEKFPQVRLIVAKENLGLNGGKNLGQKCAKGNYLLFLDSDTLVDKKMLSELVELTEKDTKIGIVCPKMYFYDRPKVIWYAGGFVNLLTSRTTNIGCLQKDQKKFNQIAETQFAPTAYLVTREVIKKLKEHSKIFFMSYGDSDYCFRAREKGFKVIFCPTAKLWHRVGVEESIKDIRGLGYTTPMRAYYFARNRVVFMKRHTLKINFIFFMIFMFPAFTLYFVYKIISLRGWSFLRPYLRGSLDGLKYALGGRVYNFYK